MERAAAPPCWSGVRFSLTAPVATWSEACRGVQGLAEAGSGGEKRVVEGGVLVFGDGGLAAELAAGGDGEAAEEARWKPMRVGPQ